jgi:hypothetical protein
LGSIRLLIADDQSKRGVPFAEPLPRRLRYIIKLVYNPLAEFDTVAYNIGVKLPLVPGAAA